MKYDDILTEAHWKKSMGLLSLFAPERKVVSDGLKKLNDDFRKINWSELSVPANGSDLAALKIAWISAKAELIKVKSAQTQALATKKYAHDMAAHLKTGKNPKAAQAASDVARAAENFAVELQDRGDSVVGSFREKMTEIVKKVDELKKLINL